MQPWPRRGTQPRMSCVRARRDCRRSHAQSTRLLEPGIELRTLAQGAALPRHRVRPPGSIPCTVTSPRRTGSSVACASSASLSGSTMARSLPPAEDDALPPSARSVRSWRANPLPGMTRMQPLMQCCPTCFGLISFGLKVRLGLCEAGGVETATTATLVGHGRKHQRHNRPPWCNHTRNFWISALQDSAPALAGSWVANSQVFLLCTRSYSCNRKNQARKQSA